MTWCHKRLSLKTIPNSEWSSFKNLVKLSCEELSYYYDYTSKMIRMGKILKMRTGTSCFTYLASLWWKNKIQKVNLRKLGWSLGRNLFKKAKKFQITVSQKFSVPRKVSIIKFSPLPTFVKEIIAQSTPRAKIRLEFWYCTFFVFTVLNFPHFWRATL